MHKYGKGEGGKGGIASEAICRSLNFGDPPSRERCFLAGKRMVKCFFTTGEEPGEEALMSFFRLHRSVKQGALPPCSGRSSRVTRSTNSQQSAWTCASLSRMGKYGAPR